MLKIMKRRKFFRCHFDSEFICDNKAVGCEAMAKNGGCVSEHKYMTENCKLTCAMCTPGM